MLNLSNIHKSFGDVRVLNGVNLRIEVGFVYTLKGGNGSGKTKVVFIELKEMQRNLIWDMYMCIFISCVQAGESTVDRVAETVKTRTLHMTLR